MLNSLGMILTASTTTSAAEASECPFCMVAHLNRYRYSSSSIRNLIYRNILYLFFPCFSGSYPRTQQKGSRLQEYYYYYSAQSSVLSMLDRTAMKIVERIGADEEFNHYKLFIMFPSSS